MLKKRQIFLNYRRADQPYAAQSIYQALVQKYGPERIFKDVRKGLRPGDDWKSVLVKLVDECDVLISIIGPKWLTVSHPDGRRRIDDQSDWVRFEISHALSKKKVVIPIYLEGTNTLRQEELPESLRGLPDKQAHFMSFEKFETDISELQDAIDEKLIEVEQRRAKEGSTYTTASLEYAKFVRFVPQSDYRKTITVIQRLLDDQTHVGFKNLSKLQGIFGRNEVRDISALSIIDRVPGKKFPKLTIDKFSNAEAILKYRAALSASLAITRAEILKNQNISTTELATAVRDRLSKEGWEAEGTLKRHGTSLRRWAIWLDPYIVNPAENSNAYAWIRHAKEGSETGKRLPKVTPELKEIILTKMRNRISIAMIAKELNISASAISRAVGEEGRKIRNEVGIERHSSTRPGRSQKRERHNRRWPDFQKLSIAERLTFANLWYNKENSAESVLSTARALGADKSIDRNQMYYLLGPRDGSRVPEWHSGSKKG